MAQQAPRQGSAREAREAPRSTAAPPAGRQQDAGGDKKDVEAAIKAEPLVETQETPVGFIILRVLANFAFYFTWLPYIVVICGRENNFHEALIFGTAFSGFCVVFNAGLWAAVPQKREFPYILDGVFLVFFMVYLIVHIYKPDGHQKLQDWELPVMHFWLGFCMLVTVAARYPFTMQYAHEAAPVEAWTAQSFKDVCDHLAGVWAGGMGIIGMLCLAPTLTHKNTGSQVLNIFFNYLFPLFMLILLLVGTRMYPDVIRRLYFLPRLLNNTVKPDGDKAAGAGTTGTDQAAGQAGSQPAGQPGAAPGGQQVLAPGQPGAAGQRQPGAAQAPQQAGQPAGAAQQAFRPPAGQQAVQQSAPSGVQQSVSSGRQPAPPVYPPVPGR